MRVARIFPVMKTGSDSLSLRDGTVRSECRLVLLRIVHSSSTGVFECVGNFLLNPGVPPPFWQGTGSTKVSRALGPASLEIPIW